MESLKEELTLLVKEGKGDVGSVLLQHENDKKKIADTIKSICSGMKETQVANFIATKLFPALLTLGNAKVRPTLLDLCCEMTRKCPINFLSKANIRRFKSEMQESYIANIETIRKTGDSFWSKVWMLLVRYLQEHLHTDVGFANEVFHIVETAFKTANDRMGAYECWTELIKNYQSNEAIIKSPKHIRLLVTPLRVKRSPVGALEWKRLEVWCLFLKVLKESGLQVLDLFLNVYYNVNEGGGNRTIENSAAVSKGAVEVFLEILGHKNLCKEFVCWRGVEHDVPVIVTPKNYQGCYKYIINNALQCTKLLEKWADNTQQEKIATCLWTTLAALSKSLDDEAALEAKKLILDFLEDAVISANQENPVSVAFIALLELDITLYAFSVFKKILTDKREGYKEALTSLLERCKDQVDATKLFKLGYHIFSDTNLEWDDDLFIAIWTLYQKYYYTISHSQYLPNEAAVFLVAYCSKSPTITNEEKLQNDKKWCELFNKLRTFQPNVVVELSRITESDKTFDSYAKRFLSLIKQACGEDVDKREYCVLQLFWDVLRCIADSPRKVFQDLMIVSEGAKPLMQVDVKRFSDRQQIELVEKIGQFLSATIFKYKVHQLLDATETFIKSLPNTLKLTMKYILYDQMYELSNNHSSGTSARAAAICNALTVKQQFHHPSIDLSRGAKLTNMLRNSLGKSKSPSKSSSKESNAQTKSSPEFPAIFGKSNGKKEEFVAIDTVVTFDKSKLSAHQKEQLKKRRDDIPSLYVDLTQDTQSQSLATEDTSSQSGGDNSAERKPRTRSAEANKEKPCNEVETPKKNSPKRSPRVAAQDTNKTDDFTCILDKETPRVVLKVVDSSKVTPKKTVVPKGSHKNSAEKNSPNVDGASKLNGELEMTEVQENEQIDQELQEIAAAVTAEQTAEVTPRKKRGRPRSSLCFTKVSSGLQDKPTRRLSATSPITLMDRLSTASPCVTRELQRLKIDACIEKLMPGIDEITTNNNNTRVTRGLSKKDKKSTETVPPENNNTQVVESSQETIVTIKPLGDEQANTKKTEVVEARKDTESCDPYEKFPVEMNIDLDRPTTPILTTSNESAIEKETDSVEIDDSLPGSPVTVETPTRTSELLLNTSDISPIRSKTPPEPSVLVQKTLEDYMQQQGVVRSSPKTVLNCGNRSRKIVDLANNQQIVEEAIVSTPVRQESDKFLTFSRELPSSSAVPPGGSILKRKKPDFTDENNSPCVKRKRVNFPDPPTTSEKLIPIEKTEEEEKITKKESTKKCKKQLIMNGSEPVIDAQISNETDSDSLEVRPTDSTLQSVEDYCEEAKNILDKAINVMDQNNEDHMKLIEQTLRHIGKAVPRIILKKYFHDIVDKGVDFL